MSARTRPDHPFRPKTDPAVRSANSRTNVRRDWIGLSGVVGRELIRVIRTANERPAGDMDKAKVTRDLAVALKLRGRNERDNWEVLARRLQVLAHSQYVTTDSAQVR